MLSRFIGWTVSTFLPTLDVVMKIGRFEIIILCGFAFCIYLFVIFKIGTIPFSDFKMYYETGQGILQGKGISNFYKYFQPGGYPYLLAVVFNLFSSNSIFLPQVLNALLLTFLLWICLKYPLARFSAPIFVGYIILAFNVNCLGMVSVLCSEIPYVFFFVLGLLMFWWGFKVRLSSKSKRRGGNFISFLISGLFLGTSQYIRPVTFAYLLSFSLFMMLGLRYFSVEKTGEGWKVSGSLSLRSLGLTWPSFFIGALILYWISGYGLTYMPHQKGLWNLYVGFNVESKGSWNPKDSELIVRIGDKYNWDSEKINGDLRQIVFDRIRKNWVKSLWILPEKVYKLMNPREVPYWTIEQSKIKNKDMIYRILGYLGYLNILALIVSIGAWFTCLVKRNISQNEFFAFCIVGASFFYLVLHGYFLEVQPRYSNHLWMLMFWCYPLSQQTVWDFLKKIYGQGGKMRRISFVLMGIGMIILLISLLADFIGLGAYPGFGKNQAIGTAVGSVVFIAGIILNRKYL
jgi:hypothetical protein